MKVARMTFLLPVRDNDGRALSREILELRDDVFARYRGWTFKGSVIGAFLMADGKQKIDICAKYTVVTAEERIGELEDLLLGFKRKTQQEAIYLELLRDIEVRFI